MPDPSHDNRIESLLSQLTLAEKAGQLTQWFYFGHLRGTESVDGAVADSHQPLAAEDALARGVVGALLYVRDPAEHNRLQRLAVEGNRLGIPALFGYDVIHGLRTIFPVPVAMAASWDPDIVERGQAVAAREARAVGIHWAFAPMIDVTRDARWGRIVEGAGEDPFLAGAMAAAAVRGFQGTDFGAKDRIIAGPKHFAGYGATVGGRDYDEAHVSDDELWNVYFPPFQAAIDAGAANIMAAYMDLNGVPCAGNRWLLADVLRDAMGFEGFVVSDANGVRNLRTQGFARDLADAGARAIDAGVDLEMAIIDPAYDHLVDAVEQGLVDEATVDASVRRILAAKERLGLFDDPYVDEAAAAGVLRDPAHREEARVAAERAAVLLRNEDGLLPLDRARLSTLAVIGPLADSRRDILGPWVFGYDIDETVTVLDGLRAALGDDVVRYAPGIRPAQRGSFSIFDMFPDNIPVDPEDFDDEAELSRAVELARSADVAVVVLGEWQNMIGEQASRSSLELPGRQLELLQAVAATGTPVVLVVMSGRPVDLRWAAEHVPAILTVWYPGTRGGEATARLLLGDVAPGGKLPFTWPRTVGHVPITYAHTLSHEPQNQGARYWDEPSTPLFPFGHGLSYAPFAYSDLTVDTPSVERGGAVTVSATVTNTGTRDAEDVAQLYIHQAFGRASRPVRELKGFRRIALAAGQSLHLEFTLGPAELRYWSAAERDWVQDRTTIEVYVGGDCTARLSTTFDVT